MARKNTWHIGNTSIDDRFHIKFYAKISYIKKRTVSHGLFMAMPWQKPHLGHSAIRKINATWLHSGRQQNEFIARSIQINVFFFPATKKIKTVKAMRKVITPRQVSVSIKSMKFLFLVRGRPLPNVEVMSSVRVLRQKTGCIVGGNAPLVLDLEIWQSRRSGNIFFCNPFSFPVCNHGKWRLRVVIPNEKCGDSYWVWKHSKISLSCFLRIFFTCE